MTSPSIGAMLRMTSGRARTEHSPRSWRGPGQPRRLRRVAEITTPLNTPAHSSTVVGVPPIPDRWGVVRSSRDSARDSGSDRRVPAAGVQHADHLNRHDRASPAASPWRLRPCTTGAVWRSSSSVSVSENGVFDAVALVSGSVTASGPLS